jgi:hypothetical protein
MDETFAVEVSTHCFSGIDSFTGYMTPVFIKVLLGWNE